ncbi:alpha/beta fold hydrolase [Frigidibacter sp. MR17.24]|uniref:alpha/beta fold hydrolase n=1 Tax=Frigidibacter sp. MR17.24 TaxID=3127345 RepID=UPI003012A2D9
MAAELALGLILAAAALALATAWRARAREAAERRGHPPEGEFVTVEGVRIHVVVRGQGGPGVRDLVLIHGASGAARDYTFALAGQLAGPYRLFIPDRPGFGWSAPAPGREALADQAALVAGAVAALGAEAPVVLGHSYGGAVALAWGLAGGPAALVLLSAPSHPWKGGMPLFYRITSTWWGQRLAVPLVSAWVRKATLRDAVAEVFAPDAVPEGYARHFGPMLSATVGVLRLNARQRKALKAELKAMVALYPGLSLPVESLHGTADEIVWTSVHARPLAAAVPGARLVELEGVGHMPHHARPGAVIAAIDRAADRAAARAVAVPADSTGGQGGGQAGGRATGAIGPAAGDARLR